MAYHQHILTYTLWEDLTLATGKERRKGGIKNATRKWINQLHLKIVPVSEKDELRCQSKYNYCDVKRPDQHCFHCLSSMRL